MRIKDERLTHTFLSHISFFNKYMKQNDSNIYFYGMTGTLGDYKTIDIYKRQFKSNILILPSFMPKRFVELPSVLCEEDESHLENICNETIYQITSGRKVLIICSTIDEAKKIREYIHNESSTYQIVLYTREEEKESILKKDNQVIIATNLAGRGTDIINDIKVEEKGGLHVILTFMPGNLRVERQAFGRTSRKGNKGSGQMILKSNRFTNIQKYKESRNEEEEKRLGNIEKDVKITILKDELFNNFCELRNKYHLNDKKKCLYGFSNDINERWGIFIKQNIDKVNNDEFDENDIREKYINFEKNLEKIIKLNYFDKIKYNNQFLRASDGCNLLDPLEWKSFNDKVIENEYYSFAAIYYNVIIEIKSINTENEKEIKEIRERNKKKWFKKSEKFVKFHDSKKYHKYLKSIDEILSNLFKYLVQPCLTILSKSEYINSEIMKQFEYIKIIIFLISQQIRQNIAIIQEYEEKPLKQYVEIMVKEIKFNQLFQRISEKNIDELGQKEAINFIQEMGLFIVYELSLNIIFNKKVIWFRFILGALGVIGGVLSLIFLPIISFIGISSTLGFFSLAFFGFVEFYKFSKTYKVKIQESEYYSHKLYMEIGRTINLIMPLVVNTMINSIGQINNAKLGNLNVNEIQNVVKELNANKEVPYVDKQYIEKTKKLEKFQDDFLIQLKEKIKSDFQSFMKEEECKNILYLLCIDKFLENKIWKNRIFGLFKENFKKYFSKIIKEQKEYIVNSIVSSFTINNEHILDNSLNDSIKRIGNIFKELCDKMKEEIKGLFVIGKYNEDEGLISLEQLIRQINRNEIDDKLSEEIVSLLLKKKIINQNGKFNDLILKKKGNKRFSQIINIKIKTIINIDNSIDKNDDKNIDEIKLEEISKTIIIDDKTQNYINTLKEQETDQKIIRSVAYQNFEIKIKSFLKKLVNLITNQENIKLEGEFKEELSEILIQKIEKK